VIEAAERINGDPRPDNTRDETPDERDARLHINAARIADLRRREEDRAAETAKARRDEQHVDDVLERALPIDQSDKGMAYLEMTRGLRNVPPRFLTDIWYVPELGYWGFRDDGGLDDKPVLLAGLPAVVALIRSVSGAVIGLAETYLDPGEPKKWSPPGYPRNKPVKVRGSKKHGLIRLGPTTETLGVAEGWINALSYYQLGFGPEDMSLAAAVDLGNMGGRAIGAVNHPTGKSADGRRARMPQGLRPDPDSPGMILPDGVRSLILIGDRDSETYATVAKMMTAAARFKANGLEVALSWPVKGMDFNEMIQKGSVP
jgi:hypothetical protein